MLGDKNSSIKLTTKFSVYLSISSIPSVDPAQLCFNSIIAVWTITLLAKHYNPGTSFSSD